MANIFKTFMFSLVVTFIFWAVIASTSSTAVEVKTSTLPADKAQVDQLVDLAAVPQKSLNKKN